MNDSSQEIPKEKAELIKRIKEARHLLEERIGSLSAEEMVVPGSNGGWSVKDHLAHLVSWTEKALAILRGQPAHEGLKFDERTYLVTSLDDLNTQLHERNRDHSLEKVLVDFRQSHHELLSVLEMIDEAVLARPADPSLPNESHKIIEDVVGNSYAHDLEHLSWIENLLKDS